MSEAMYSVGQVLFIVLNKKSQIYPMQIVEVIHKRTLKGEDVKYVLQGGLDKSTTIMLDEVEGEIFDSAERARSTLLSRVTQQVNNIVNVALKKAEEWYGFKQENKINTIENLPDLSTLSEPQQQDTQVILPDGTIAKVKISAVV